MANWTVVLKIAASHRNSTGEHPFAVRAETREEAVEKAREAFTFRDMNDKKSPSRMKRTLEPTVREVIRWADCKV